MSDPGTSSSNPITNLINSGWDISKAGEKIVDRCFSLFETELSRYNSVEEQLTRLRTTVESINAVLTDAEERREINDDSVLVWLRQLRSIAFDSDDLLDSHQTALAVYKLRKASNQSEEGQSRKRKRFPIEISFSPEWGPVHRRRIATEIEKIEKRLDVICKNKKNLKLGKDDGRRREEPNERTRPMNQQGSSHDPAQIVGRETELEEVVGVLAADLRLVSGSGRTVPVVVIHGAAGIGKTTLARMAYNDSRVQSYFDLRVWVDLANRSDVVSVTKEIYEKMSKQRCDHGSLDTIQDLLRGYLDLLVDRDELQRKRKFLIVMDNLWEESFHFWEALRIPLLTGEEGSKVLITTQNESTCKLMKPMLHQTNLTGLGKEQCWDLFCSFALPEGVEGQDDELIQVGMHIADECYGSPLAVKTLGALLKGKDEREWRAVLDELRVLEQDRNGTLPSLLISYHHLPYPMKKCFAYCCIFPNGYLFEKDQLIRYWLAEGLIPYEGRRRLEHVGTKYFDEFIWRSFFEKLQTDRNKGEVYRIPSLMHDLAIIISNYEFVDLGNDSSKITEKGHFRYASLLHRDGESLPVENAYNFKNLRTLILCSDSKAPLTKVPPELFLTLAHLRVLDLGNSELTTLPEMADDQLIHLRYLGLSNTKIKNLPKSVCKLHNLQTLELSRCTDLAELPEDISKLVNLRHLGFHIDWENIIDRHSLHIPEGINHLSYLQTLSRFTVASCLDGKCNICELKNLNLRGDLCIANLENIINHQDAMEANIGKKDYVDRLMLRWSDKVSMDYNQLARVCSVAESLRPSNSLRCLWFVNYPGQVFPNWLGNSSFKRLQTIRISNLEYMPSLGSLPRLKDLFIEKLKVRILFSFVGYPSLEILTIKEMPIMEKFIQENDIPSLHKLEVSDCPELREVVIHRNFHYNRFDKHNCAKQPQVVCVPQD